MTSKKLHLLFSYSLLLFVLVFFASTPSYGKRYRFQADVTGQVPEDIQNDMLWSWQKPGLFGSVVPLGTAADDTESGVAGAEIIVRTMKGREVLRTGTDDYGQFKFSIDPGHYRVMVFQRDYVPLTTAAWPCVVSQGRAGQLRIPLKPLSAATSADRERSREETALFENYGPMCGLLLKVRTTAILDKPASPVSNAEVTIYDKDGNPLRTAVSDDEGYVIFKLESGAYALSGEADGFVKAGAGSEGVHVAPGELTLHAMTMLTQEDIDAGRRGVGRAPNPYGQKATTNVSTLTGIAGCVYLKDQMSDQQIGLDGVQVVAVKDDGKTKIEARTAADGTYNITLPKPGYYLVLSRKDGYTQVGEYGKAQRVRRGDLTEHDIQLQPMDILSRDELAQREQLWKMYVEGDSASGVRGFLYARPPLGGRMEPVTDVEVVLIDRDGNEVDSQYVNAKGRFSFACEPGKYKVEVRSPDYRPARLFYRVKAGRVISKGMRLRRRRRR